MTVNLLYFTSGARERVLEALLDAGHKIDCVFTTSPDHRPQIQPSVDLARANGIPVRTVSRGDLPSLVNDVRERICLSVGFAYIFPEEVVAAAREFLNVHGTLLPKYPGARTLNWVLVNGEKENGVTIHRVDAGVDTGPILLQRSFPVSKFDSAKSLARKTAEFEPEVVLEALSLLESGGGDFVPQIPIQQDGVPNRTPSDSELNPQLALSELYDSIRACDPDDYPAHFFVDREKVCIRIWRPDKPDNEADMV